MENITPGNTATLEEDIEFEELPSRNYAIKNGHWAGYIDEHAAIVQSVFCILNTERYAYPIFDWSWGFESSDLIGEPMDYVIGQLFERIPDALYQDTRITDILDLEITEAGKRTLVATFTVESIFGSASFSEGVEINV